MNINDNSSRLNVLFIPGWYSLDNSMSTVYVNEHAKAIAKYCSLVVIYSQGIKKLFNKNKYISDNKNKNIRIISLNHRKFYLLIFDLLYFINIYKIYKYLKKEGYKPDIVHANVHNSTIPAYFIARKYNVPMVISLHSSDFYKKDLKQKIKFHFLRKYLEKFNYLLPVSNNLKKAIESHNINNKYFIIPNTVNTKLFNIRNININNNKKIKLLFVGNLKKEKGVDVLINAIMQLSRIRKDFILDIIGDGIERKKLKKLVKYLDVEKYIEFHGSMEKQSVAKYMQDCHIYVQPSRYETFGVTFVEAMSCGKPVVATNIPALKEKINKERGVLVPVDNTEKLFQALLYVINNYKKYSSKLIRQYVVENYSYEIIGKKFNYIYTRAINKI